jgi:hypothetical protein
MHNHDKRVPNGSSRAEPALSSEEIEAKFQAAVRREIWALLSREIWRAEMAARRASPPRPLDETERRKAFAKAIARLELGRAYWDERLAAFTPSAPKRRPGA